MVAGGRSCLGRVVWFGELGMLRGIGDIFTLPVQNHPPARIYKGVFRVIWPLVEGTFVFGGQKCLWRAKMTRSEGVQVLSYRWVLASRVRNVQENEGMVSTAVEPQ